MSGALASPLAMDGASFKSSFIFLNSGWLEREIWVLNENSRGSRLVRILVYEAQIWVRDWTGPFSFGGGGILVTHRGSVQNHSQVEVVLLGNDNGSLRPRSRPFGP